MRILIPLLLLSAATPALAEPVEPGQRAERAEQRQQQRQERAAERAAERPQPRFERPSAPAMPQFERPQPSQVQNDGGQRRFEGGRSADGGQRWRDRGGQPGGAFNGGPRPTGDSVADWRGRRGGERPGATAPNPAVRIDSATYGYRDGRDPNRDQGRWQGRDGRRDGGTWAGRDGRRDSGNWTGRDGRRDGGNWTGRDGRPAGSWTDRRTGTGAWRPDWRRDPRYDWQRYRDRNRSIFHIGVYVDPFGWGYRPIDIGYQLYPNYYAEQYWIGDPGYYSLPPVEWPYRWVRYYNDALLIDVRSGQVVDAIQSFFW